MVGMKVLIVEDEEKLACAINRGLKQEGYAAECIYDGEEAQVLLETQREDFDLVILDVMLPKKDGITLIKELRRKNINIPVIMLTARDASEDKIHGLDSGADDYLVKPFEFGELLARVRALLRRPATLVGTEIKIKDLKIDLAKRRVFRGNREILLTSKEFLLLAYLGRNAGAVLTREQIIAHLWDFAYEGFSNLVDVHIKNLRKKIDPGAEQKLLETVRGAGYRLRSDK